MFMEVSTSKDGYHKKKTINFRNSAGVTSDTGLLAIIHDQMILVALFI